MQAVHGVKALNRQSVRERKRRFRALDLFVNMGDGLEDWKVFRTLNPGFLPDIAYVGASHLTSLEGKAEKKPMIYWYRDALRKVWRYMDPDGVYLDALLGLEWDIRLFQDWDESIAGAGTLGRSVPHANWHTGEIVIEFKTEFQTALFALMRDHWRAKVCPECGQYFIADKTAQSYCSPACYAEMKRKYALNYWRAKGSARRARKRRKKQK